MIIPALDLLYGNVVRLKQGDYAQRTVFKVDPVHKIQEAYHQGAELVHIVDLQGAKDPLNRQKALISRIVKCSPVPIQTGGGIRSDFDVSQLLKLGVERVVIGSLAVKKPEMCRNYLKRFGPEHITLALDVRIENGVPYVATHGWLKTSNQSIDAVLRHYLPYKLKHLLVTDISRDGMMSGCNNNLYELLSKRYPELDIIASGGISCLDDIKAVALAGASSVVLGRALLERRFTVEEALKCWPNA